jgi:tRNA(adenine34) deaminase
MARALALAEAAAARGEVPVGAVLVGANGHPIAEAANEVEARDDPTAHAEILALARGAAVLGRRHLDGCDLWVTLEPCALCAAAIALRRVRRLYFAASDPKGGAVDHGPRLFRQPTCHHRPEVYSGMREREAEALLKGFFQALR